MAKGSADEDGGPSPPDDEWPEFEPLEPASEDAGEAETLPPRFALLRCLATVAALREDMDDAAEDAVVIRAARHAFDMGWLVAADAYANESACAAMHRALHSATDAITSWFAEKAFARDDQWPHYEDPPSPPPRKKRGARIGTWDHVTAAARTFSGNEELRLVRPAAVCVAALDVLGVPFFVVAQSARLRALRVFDRYAEGADARRSWDDDALAADAFRYLGHDPRRFNAARRVARHRAARARGETLRRKAPDIR